MRILTVAVLIGWIPAAKGDIIELKSGEKIEGRFERAGPAGAVINVAGHARTVPLAAVRRISFGEEPKRTALSPAARAALDAVRAIRSVVEAGVNLQQYSSRVLDAKVAVDRYLASASGSANKEFRSAIVTALYRYQVVSRAWALSFQNSSEAYTRLAAIGDEAVHAPEMKDCLSEAESVSRLALGLAMGSDPQRIWACAASKVSEAEALAR
jgi:hypothetical protein